jgi:hypothetical protein
MLLSDGCTPMLISAAKHTELDPSSTDPEDASGGTGRIRCHH